jgi:hypothetical protein
MRGLVFRLLAIHNGIPFTGTRGRYIVDEKRGIFSKNEKHPQASAPAVSRKN